jgi:hypothetical protein
MNSSLWFYPLTAQRRIYPRRLEESAKARGMKHHSVAGLTCSRRPNLLLQRGNETEERPRRLIVRPLSALYFDTRCPEPALENRKPRRLAIAAPGFSLCLN